MSYTIQGRQITKSVPVSFSCDDGQGRSCLIKRNSRGDQLLDEIYISNVQGLLIISREDAMGLVQFILNSFDVEMVERENV